jgi:acyl carrier protein
MTQASFAQHGIRMADKASRSTAYHMPLLIHVGDEVDADTLSKACAALVERHSLLAAALLERAGIAYLAPAETAPDLRVANAGEKVEDEIARAFDLDRGPLIRFALFGSDLVVTAHHAVFDGFSKDLLVRDLIALRDGTEISPLSTGFAQHAEAERRRVERVLAEAREFWRTRWSEPAPVVVRDVVLSSRRAAAGEALEFALPKADIAGLTTFEATMTALHALLYSYGNSRIVTAIDLSTRTPETADLIGPFVNELPLASEPAAELTFREFGLRLRAELRDLYRFREVPLARAVPRVAPHAALAPISVSYRERAHRPSDDVEWLVFNGAVRGELQLQFVDAGDELTVSLRHSTHAAKAAPRFADDLAAVLRRVSESPDSQLADLLTLEPAKTAEATQAQPGPQRGDGGVELAGELVEQVREIWQEVLGIERIELDDDLFDLGGHSLTITRIIARMRARLDLDIPLDVFFDHPTIAGALDAVDVR